MEQKFNKKSGERREGARQKHDRTGNRPRIYRRNDSEAPGGRPEREETTFRPESGFRQAHSSPRPALDAPRTPRRPNPGKPRHPYSRTFSAPGSRFPAPQYNQPVDDEAAREQQRQKHYSKKKQLEYRIKQGAEAPELRLNRYISIGGVCSRRDADTLITEGRVKVNGKVVQAVGGKVKRSDKVEVDGRIVLPEQKVYLVLNKPKDYVTTVEDPLERKTVMSLLEGACKERVYPIGRLDRQTSGVLLFTNDGDLAKKLTHPKYEHKKIYHVFLNKPLEQSHLDAISHGIELEDGPIKADEISYVSTDHSEIGIEVHSGRNRIVRRIFEHFDYRIERLDRVYFAGITKKNLPRGKWRFLTPQEVKILKVYKKM